MLVALHQTQVGTEEAAPDYEGRTDFAWAFWFHWRGATDLLAHIARKSKDLLAKDVADTPSVVITLHVGADAEQFSSPEDFLANATAQGLRSFSGVLVSAKRKELKVDIWIVRQPVETASDATATWLTEGVLLEVTGTGEGVIGVRNALVAAISRGKLGRNEPARSGETRSTRDDLAADRRRKQPTERIMRRVAFALPVLWAAVCMVGLIAAATGDLFDESIGAVAVGAISGVTVPALTLVAFPNVIITDLTRPKVLLNILAGLPVGALIGLVAQGLG